MSGLEKYSVAYGTPLAAFQSSDLNSKTRGSFSVGTGAAAVIDNHINLDLWMDVYVQLGSFTAITGDFFRLWLLTSMDGGATYEDSVTAPGAGTPSYAKAITVGASAKKAIVRRIILPPGYSKLVFESQCATLASSGNSISYWTYSKNLNG